MFGESDYERRMSNIANIEEGFKKGYAKGYADAKKGMPHGEWLEWDEDNGYPCSVCGEYLPHSEEYDYQTLFCPNCGAKMKKEGEEK